MKKRKKFLPVLIMLFAMLVGGQTVFAADTTVQVTAHLTENTVEITGNVQSSEITEISEIGVLILSKNVDFNLLSSEDIVYANQYELGENGAFGFKAELPNADLKEYVLQIGDETGLLYRKLLDGSDIPESSPSNPEGGDNSQNPPSDSDSEQGGESQNPDLSNPDDTDNDSQDSGTNKDKNSNEKVNNAKTGDSQNSGLWICLMMFSIIVFAAVILIMKKKKGGRNHA